jgi:hypothetical protein
MQPHIKHSHTRIVLHPHPSCDLFNGRAWLALMVGVPLASELALLLTDSVQLGGTMFPKETEV